MKRAYLTTAIALALSTAVGCSPASDQQPTSAEQNKIWPKLAQLRVNPRPIGRGQCALWVYKREPRSAFASGGSASADPVVSGTVRQDGRAVREQASNS